MKPHTQLILLFGVMGLGSVVIGCGSDTRDLENYANTDGNFVLQSASQHVGGYGRTECLVCHHAALNIHRRSGTALNVDQLNDAVRRNGEAQYCLTCHGSNGTQ